MTDKAFILYGAEFSLYSGKVRSYLRKKGLTFEERLSTLKVYQSFIIPRTGVRFIPVVQTPDDQVYQDTTVIIDEMEKRFPQHSVYPRSVKQGLVSLLLELYGDEWLIIPAMHYRWHYKQQNARFIYRQFGQLITPRAPEFVQRFLGKRLGKKFKNAVKKLGVTEQNYKAIEKSYLSFLNDLNNHFSQHDYLLGSKPCIADFGFMGPLYAHLYRDPAPAKIMRDKAPAVVNWIERMNNDCPALHSGSFLNDDHIPPTLIPILKRMTKEQMPVIKDTDEKLSQWHQHNLEPKNIPLMIGQHQFQVEGVEEQRAILPYCLWMFRRVINFYENHKTSELEVFLEELGLKDMLNDGLKNKLTRVNNVLCFDD